MVDMIKLWMPITKSADGTLHAILSDDSLDRDDEFMDKELLEDWAKSKVILPALVNHENKMASWVGGWKDKKVVSKKINGRNRNALMAKPLFFSKEANPVADQIKKQVEEALEMGMNPGISIGAIPDYESCYEKEINGKKCRGYKKAELVEATWVPIQSNRNASYGHLAKMFDLEKSPEDINLEENTMNEEILKALQDMKKEIEDLKSEKSDEEKAAEEKAKAKPAEEKKAEEAKAEEAKAEEAKENKELKAKLDKMEKTLSNVLAKAVNVQPSQQPNVENKEAVVKDEDFTLEKMYGGMVFK